MSLLERILASKRDEIAHLPAAKATTRTPLDVCRALRRDHLALVTEIKFKSPSAGELSRSLTAAERALVYARGGAAMISVLCDGPFFGGSYEDLASVRAALDAAALPVPVLAKEFVLDVRQLDMARAMGADAILIIARITEDLPALVHAATDRGLEPIVEVVTDEELTRALASSTQILGVNARDLDTLAMDPARAARIMDAIPADRIAIHFSGIRNEYDITTIRATRANAALIGEALMREAPENILKRFIAGSN